LTFCLTKNIKRKEAYIGVIVSTVCEQEDLGIVLVHAIEQSGQAIVPDHIFLHVLDGEALQVAVIVHVIDGQAHVLKDSLERDENVTV
jgi:hypothetical protein